MKLYVYAPEHGSPLDFCVRQNKDNTNEYVICDVKKDGIAYGAGARAGDRVQAYSKVQSLGYKKFRKWEPETLNELNMETQRQLIVLSVDKRVPLRKEEEKHALTRKHRLSFMRKMLETQARVEHLLNYVRLWDEMFPAPKSKRQRSDKYSVAGIPKKRRLPTIVEEECIDLESVGY